MLRISLVVAAVLLVVAPMSSATVRWDEPRVVATEEAYEIDTFAYGDRAAITWSSPVGGRARETIWAYKAHWRSPGGRWSWQETVPALSRAREYASAVNGAGEVAVAWVDGGQVWLSTARPRRPFSAPREIFRGRPGESLAAWRVRAAWTSDRELLIAWVAGGSIETAVVDGETDRLQRVFTVPQGSRVDQLRVGTARDGTAGVAWGAANGAAGLTVRAPGQEFGPVVHSFDEDLPYEPIQLWPSRGDQLFSTWAACAPYDSRDPRVPDCTSGFAIEGTVPDSLAVTPLEGAASRVFGTVAADGGVVLVYNVSGFYEPSLGAWLSRRPPGGIFAERVRFSQMSGAGAPVVTDSGGILAGGSDGVWVIRPDSSIEFSRYPALSGTVETVSTLGLGGERVLVTKVMRPDEDRAQIVAVGGGVLAPQLPDVRPPRITDFSAPSTTKPNRVRMHFVASETGRTRITVDRRVAGGYRRLATKKRHLYAGWNQRTVSLPTAARPLRTLRVTLAVKDAAGNSRRVRIRGG